MKNNWLTSLPSSFYWWFLTPLFTFCIFLSGEHMNLGLEGDRFIKAISLSPIIGCISLSLWLSYSAHSSAAWLFVKTEIFRALYIFIIGFVYLIMIGQSMYENDNIGHALNGVTFFLFISFFFYVVPDILIAILNVVLRKLFPKLSRSVAIVATSLLGLIGYYFSYSSLFHFFA